MATTVQELIEALMKIEEPATTEIFLSEVDDNGETIKGYGSNITIVGLNLIEKDLCTHTNKDTCGCIDIDMLHIDYME